MLEKLVAEAKEFEEQLIRDYQNLHRCAETGFELTKTKAYVEKCLRRMGYEPKVCGKCGLVASAGNPADGKVFLLRADMDALPVREETGLHMQQQRDVCMPADMICIPLCFWGRRNY